MTYQHVVCLSSSPRHDSSPYPGKAPLPEAVTDVTVPTVAIEADGEAVIEVSLPSTHLQPTSNYSLTIKICRHIQ